MSDDRKGGLALIAGTVGFLITMSLHPTGHDLVAPGQLARMTHLTVAVHSLALASVPVLFLGAFALTRRLASPDRLAIGALVIYSFAGVAGVNAAVAGGLVSPGLVRQMLDATSPDRETWDIVLHYNGYLNQAFAQIYVVASSVAIVLWSAAILRNRALARGVAIYGCLAAPLIVLALLAGHLRLNVHGFGLVVLSQAVWFITVGVLLSRPRPA